jgi:hypothetical protein
LTQDLFIISIVFLKNGKRKWRENRERKKGEEMKN